MPVIAMFCEKCGKELPEDSRFCLDCGQPVVPEEPSRPKEKKKKSHAKYWLLSIASVLFASGVLIAIFFADIAAWAERLVLSPEMLMKKALFSVAQEAGIGETENILSLEIPHRYEMGLYLDEDIQKFLSAMGEGDSTWLTELNLQLMAGEKDGVGKAQLSLLFEEVSIVSLDVIQNEEAVWIGFPELNERYLEISPKDLGYMENSLKTGKEMAELMRPYGTILFDSIHRVTKKDTSLKIDGVCQDVLQLTATIRPEDVRQAVLEMAERLKEDKAVRDVLNDLAQDDVHAQVVSQLKDLAAKADLAFQLILYLDKYNKPIGFEVVDGNGKSLLYYAKATDDGEFASRLTCHDIVLTGSGTTSGGKDTGLYRLTADGKTVLTYQTKDFCLKENGFSGSLFFPLDGILSESSGLPNTQMGLELSQKTENGAQVLSFGFVVEKKTLFGVIFSAERIKDFKANIPESIIPVEETQKVEKWLESLDWSSISRKLTDAGVPVSTLESLMG